MRTRARCVRRDRRREVTTIATSRSPIFRRSSFRSSESIGSRATLPELPEARRERYRREHADFTDYDIDVLTASAAMGDYFEQVARQSDDPKTAANWMMGEVLAALKSTGQAIEQFARAAGGSRRAARDGARRRRQSQRREAGLRRHGRDRRSSGGRSPSVRVCSRSATTLR